MAKRESTLSIDGRTLTLSNVDKVLWPKDGITKGDLIKYYASVSRWMVPYLAGRPLSLQRYPDGIGGGSFFSKNVPVGAPNWLKTVSLKSDGKRDRISYVLCDDGATLVYLANLAAITLHV
jgi:bifunctional non-homologous end joining protein LigD